MMNHFCNVGPKLQKNVWNKTPIYNGPRYDKILVVMNTIPKLKLKIYGDTTNKFYHAACFLV